MKISTSLCIICITFVLNLPIPALAQGPLQSEIEASLRQGADAWNRGDLPAFMEGYVKGSEMTYTAGGRVVRGSQALMDRYQSTYGDKKESMGRLRFEDIETWPLGSEHALALGRWILDFPGAIKAPAEGVFSLVLRKQGRQWEILHDHSSRTQAEK